MREIINKQKAPKDTVLNNIMKEIGEENGLAVTENTEKLPKKKKKKKYSWLNIFFNIILLFIVLVILFVVYTISIATDTKEHQKIIVPIEISKMDNKHQHSIPLAKIKTQEKETTQKTTKTVKQKIEPISETEKAVEIWKKAKASLLQQMKN